VTRNKRAASIFRARSPGEAAGRFVYDEESSREYQQKARTHMGDMMVTNGGAAAAQNTPQSSDSLLGRARLALDNRRMKRDLSRWFTAAKDFKANGLPSGSPAYQQLYQQSCDKIISHSEKWGIAPEKITVEMPGLYSLQRLTEVTPPKTRANPLVAVIALVLALFGLSAALGGASGVYHLVERLITK
jgi:hypothetical protein